MHTAEAIGEIFKGKASKEIKDKIETIKADKYSLYFLFDGVFALANTSRAIAIAKKFASANFAKYEKGKSYRLSDLMSDINKDIIASNLPNPHTAFAAAFVPVDEEQEAKVSWLGEVGVCAISNKNISDLTNRGSKQEKLLGMSKTKSGDFREAILRNTKNGILLCSDGFYGFMEGKKADLVKIFNNNKLLGTKVAITRFVKNRTFQDATYVYIRRG